MEETSANAPPKKVGCSGNYFSATALGGGENRIGLLEAKLCRYSYPYAGIPNLCTPAHDGRCSRSRALLTQKAILACN